MRWSLSIDQESDVLRQTVVALSRRERPALTTRQLGVFLTFYLMDEVQTVHGLAAKLNASKSATTRALERLSELGLVRRKADPLDRRSILIQRTTAGAALLVNIKSILAERRKKSGMQMTTPRQDETSG